MARARTTGRMPTRAALPAGLDPAIRMEVRWVRVVGLRDVNEGGVAPSWALPTGPSTRKQ